MERKLIHRLQELPHEAVEFQTNEFMSLVRKHPIVRDSPAPEKKTAALQDSETSEVWNADNEGNDGDMYALDDGNSSEGADSTS